MERQERAGRELRRARWPLLIVSVALILYLLDVVRISGPISIYGVQVQVSETKLVYIAWLLWFSFLINYCYRHFWSSERREEFLKYYSPAMDWRLGKKEFRRYRKEEKKRLKEDPQGESGHHFLLRKAKAMQLYRGCWEVTVDISVAYRIAGGMAGGGPADRKAFFTGRELFFLDFLARMYVFFLTPYGLEYWSPYVVAAIPVVILIVNST